MSAWQYLWAKAVAKAWKDPAWGCHLIDGDAKKVIKDTFLHGKDEEFPLPSWVDLDVRGLTPEQAPWIREISYWILPPNDVVWALPRPPEDALEAPVALADFAAQIALFDTRLRGISPKPAAANEDPTMGFNTTVAWTLRWPEAVALAWRNADFREALLRDPRLALFEAFAIEVPPSTHLVVEDYVVSHKRHRAGLATLTMNLPHPPPDHKDAALALGEYLASGTSNPFTLCI